MLRSRPSEQASFIIAVGAFALLAQLLHTLPCVTVYDWFVVVLKDYLLFFGVLLALLYLVGHFLGLEVHKAARVFPVFKDMRHGACRPLALIAGVVAAGASCPAVFQLSPVMRTGVHFSIRFRFQLLIYLLFQLIPAAGI